MAKEILFKAKRKDNGEWVEGYFLNVAKINAFICTGKIKLDGALKGIVAPEMHAVDQSTICRYTGLTDKNDNKIWENDIVTEDWRNEKGIVRFGEFEAQVLKNIGFNIEWNYISYRQDICYWVGKCEVIGNVFDNPELLEGGNE